jgi:hypothetical protein
MKATELPGVLPGNSVDAVGGVDRLKVAHAGTLCLASY